MRPVSAHSIHSLATSANPKRFILATLCSLFCAACGSGSSGSSTVSPPPTTVPDWELLVDTNNPGTPLSSALVGYYDLSGALLDFENVPGLNSAMSDVGFAGPGGLAADWRIGLGRWELGTEIFDTLTDGTVCTNRTPENEATFSTDLELIANRDWFTFTDGSPVLEADITDNRYALDYVRSVIDAASTFGANPYISIDHMPRSLSINQTPSRTDCSASFTNSVSNNQPADSVVFSKAVAGLVQRVVEGTGTKTGADRPRSVTYWEVWNEPELAFFWEPTLAVDPDAFFDMAISVLLELDSYRSTSAVPAAQAVKIGLASFANEGTAVATVQSFDAVNLPMDFISFHGYNDDPLVIVDAITAVESATQNSTNYQDIELVLGEWGPDLMSRAGDQQYAMTMEPALHAATVVSLGAYVGLDRAHNAIFYNYDPLIALGLLDNNVTPRPLYRAYELMSKLINDTTEHLTAQGSVNGRLDAGMGAVLVSRDTVTGTVRALLVNRNASARVVQISLNGSAATPTVLYVFDENDDPADPLRTVGALDSDIELPARSLALAEF